MMVNWNSLSESPYRLLVSVAIRSIPQNQSENTPVFHRG